MFLILVVVLGGARAAPPPVQAIEKHATRLRALEVRPATLTGWVQEAIDLEEVSARLLGPHRRSFSVEQRSEFSRLFVAILVARAWQRAEALNDFDIACSIDEGPVVRCDLRRGSETARAWFTVSGGRIIDARVGDMGLVKENRGAIDRLIRARGVDGLLERMRRRVTELHRDRDARRRRP